MSGASGGSTHAPNRCLYVALNIPRNASPSDIKKAYRREALVWHPDKNVGNEAEAQGRFQEVQHAYAVLSDAHERKWYDDHRDEILNPRSSRYGDGNDSDDDDERGKTVNLTKYFSASAFTGFGNDEAGFYQTYSRAFREVWNVEKDWGDVEASSGADSAGKGFKGWGEGDAPEMGTGSDPYEVADAFYSTWSGFVSGLSFGWVDEYNVNEAENRRVRRLIEKENSKKRAVARRKYQDDVRTLVEFCRRRDKRVIKHKLQLAKEKEAREKRRVEEALSKKAEIKLRKEEWLREKQAEQEAEEEERAKEGGSAVFRLGESDDSDDDDGHKRKGKRGGGKKAKGDGQKVLVFRCAVCKKDFKSAGQMQNHETSKAHKKKMEELDKEMLREARASGKRRALEDQSEEASASEEIDSSQDKADEEDSDEEGEDNDFFVENAMRELDLSSGLDEVETKPRGTNVGSAGGIEASTSPRSSPPESADTQRPVVVGNHGAETERKHSRRPSKCEGKESEHESSRDTVDGGKKSGFDLFSSSSSSGSDKDDSDSDSNGDESESGSEGKSSGDEAEDGSIAETAEADSANVDEVASIAMATASATALAFDSDGKMQHSMGVAAKSASATFVHSAAQEFNVDEKQVEGVMSSAASAAYSWFKGHATAGVGAPDNPDKPGSTDEDSENHEHSARDHRHAPHSPKHDDKPKHESISRGKGGRCKRKSGQSQRHSSKSEDSEGAERSDGRKQSGDRYVEELAPAGKRGRRKAGGNKKQTGQSAVSSDAEEDKGARRRRRQANKSARAASHGKGGPRKGGARGGGDDGDGAGSGEDAASCRVCGKHFPSRSKMFAHVKREGHALAS